MARHEGEVGRLRLRRPKQPWGPWFVFVERDDLVVRLTPSPIVSLRAWRTDYRHRCECGRVWLGGPGTLCGVDACPGCGSVYWRQES